ncbi:hypothetical protein BJX70DRAFT_368472 [Aspergillus crustosus]
MGKKSKSQPETSSQPGAGTSLPFLGGKASVDPSLASLFEKSAGPVKVPEIPRKGAAVRAKRVDLESNNDEEDSIQDNESPLGDEIMEDAKWSAEHTLNNAVQAITEPQNRKRKRAVADDLEDSYMRRLAKEEQKEQKKRRAEKSSLVEEEKEYSEGLEREESQAEEDADPDDENEAAAPPKHESLTGGGSNDELSKSNRTIFLSNVSSKAITSKSAKKDLLKHLASFLSTLPESTGPHKIDSIRFRSTAFASGGKIPKRAAFAQQEIHDDTTPSTNAYVVYSTPLAAKKAPAALNGTVVLERHLRVDSVAHPAKVDHKRCVFVGNLDFIDNETNTPEGEKKKKKRAPADVEEGLWRTFNAHTKGSNSTSSRGSVESVRVIRDRATRVGKGFAYVQFHDPNSVEEALLLNEKNFPPLLPRKLRVVRAKKVAKKPEENHGQSRSLADAERTLHGRAGKLLGRSSAARLKASDRKSISQNSLVFEGNRATSDGTSRIRVRTKSRGSKVKRDSRSKKRAAAYKAAGGKRSQIEK